MLNTFFWCTSLELLHLFYVLLQRAKTDELLDFLAVRNIVVFYTKCENIKYTQTHAREKNKLKLRIDKTRTSPYC